MTAPGERLVADAQAACLRALGQPREVGGEDFRLVQRLGLGVAADQQQFGAQLLHHVELALGTVEVALHELARAALEVAERLEQRDADAELLAQPPHFGRAARVMQQIGLEQLDGVEAGRGDGAQLVRQAAAQRNRGDRPRPAPAALAGTHPDRRSDRLGAVHARKRRQIGGQRHDGRLSARYDHGRGTR
ncbi:hypothetical protein SSTU70S_00089 [Stutzerimonas stutzeri]